MKINIDIIDFIDKHYSLLFSLLLIIVSIASAWLITVILKKQKNRYLALLDKYKLKNILLFPTVLMTILLIVTLLAPNFFTPHRILTITNKASLIFFILRLISILLNHNTIRVLIYILIPIFILDELGLLNKTSQYLETLAIKLGKFSLSALFIIKIFILFVVFMTIAGVAKKYTKKSLSKFKWMHQSTRQLINKFFEIAIYFILGLVSLNILGIDLTGLAIVGGALSFGIGFGLQQIISNFISGVILLFERSISHNDLIELSDGTLGYVKKLGARATLIECFDNKEILVPNEKFITSEVTNWTLSNKLARVDINIGTEYGSDYELVIKIVKETMLAHPMALKDPEPNCYLTEFADNSVNFLGLFWIKNINEGRLQPKSDVLINIWKALEKNNISIPFPQRDIYIKNLPELTKSMATQTPKHS